jgi:ABC-type transport system involved in multi-copper enzyme maturation permease subunit
MNTVARALWNPIVAKEYRSRMRTWRSPVTMTIFILLVGGLGWAIFSAMASASRYTGSSSVNQYGPQLFMWLIIFEVVLLAFITPALTAGAISGERERQTIDLLFVTPLRPFAIIWGKLLASMSFVILLLMLSVPIFSLVFLLGGIELDQMIYAFIVVGVSALTFGLVGIAFSSLFRRTLAATVAAYGAAFVLMVGTLVYGLLFPIEIDASAGSVPAPPAVTMLSPILPLVTIANNAPIPCYGSRYSNSARDAILRSGGGGYIGPQTASSTVLCVVSGGGYQTAMAMSKGSYGSPSQTSATAGTKITSGLFQNWQYWQANVVMQLVICFLALALSAYILPPIRKRIRLRAQPAPEPWAG